MLCSLCNEESIMTEERQREVIASISEITENKIEPVILNLFTVPKVLKIQQ